MLSKAQIQHLAGLTRIELSDKEIEQYRQELSSILDYVSKLEEANVDQIEVEEESFNQGLRLDQARECRNKEELIRMAPAKEGRLIKVGKVI